MRSNPLLLLSFPLGKRYREAFCPSLSPAQLRSVQCMLSLALSLACARALSPWHRVNDCRCWQRDGVVYQAIFRRSGGEWSCVGCKYRTTRTARTTRTRHYHALRLSKRSVKRSATPTPLRSVTPLLQAPRHAIAPSTSCAVLRRAPVRPAPAQRSTT